ncbi:MAG: MgtC/SapB family protein [Dehalococcoidia bacterium]|jgi:putative Mg2+ transporter-C (MgtC) family protein|nr:MgtC/SapB family protein [Dehalococcoidia bacterium]
MYGDWSEMVVRLLVATALAAAIGYEREARGKSAGLRTHMLIAIGAAGFTLASLYGFGDADISRVASGVVAGVGFIGAGVIFRGGHGEGIAGLTTAASIWVTAGVGVAAACGLYLLALALSVLSVIVLELPKARD